VSDPAAWEVSTCRVPMWSMGGPDGFCNAVAYGYQLPREILEYERGYGANNRAPYCFGHCCPNHGGPRETEIRIFQDGHTGEGYPMWCAVNPDFENLQESPAGFDGNPFRAREYLAAALTYAPVRKEKV
jgi:hypothetical protein